MSHRQLSERAALFCMAEGEEGMAGSKSGGGCWEENCGWGPGTGTEAMRYPKPELCMCVVWMMYNMVR